MRVFQFSFGDGYAGSAKIAILSSKLLQDKGYSVTLFVSKNSLTEKRGTEEELNIISLDSSKKFKELITEIVTYFKNEKPLIVISHHSLDRKVGFELKKKFKNEFLNIGYRHNISKSFPVIGPLLYNHYYDYLIACSKGVGDSLITSGVKSKKVKIIYNGISVPENINSISGTKIKSECNLNDKIVLGMSTWFHKERKGFDILFEAFRKLDSRFVLLIVGIPEKDQKSVLDYASEFNISNSKIIMPGYVDNIWEYYKSMDIFLLPSRSEGFSLSLLEAAASHLPIIASNIPGNNEFIFNNKNGLLFNIENPTELKEEIQVLSSDKKMRYDLSNNAYESVMKNYLIKNYADNLDNFLKQISQ